MRPSPGSLRWIFITMTVVIGGLGISPVFDNDLYVEEYQQQEHYWESCSYIWEHRSYSFPAKYIKKIEKEYNAFPSSFEVPASQRIAQYREYQ